jgi:hypothetical protein
LVINTAEVKRSDPVTHKETVKRAQLVTHNETFKRAELVRSSRQWFPVITASQELLKKPPGVIRYSVPFTKDIPELLDRARKLGLEGLIGKRSGSR